MRRASLLLFASSLCAMLAAAPADAAEAPADKPAEQPADKAAEAPPSDAETVIDDILELRFLDPAGEFWLPRRGERWELSLLLGGEGALGPLATGRIPTAGGVVVNVLGRYYPVDRMAVVLGTRAYFGLDGVPAAGTTASTAVSAIAGVRTDLVRENRFSLLWDLYSGPSLFVFADLLSAPNASTAVGGEMGTAFAFRYTLGPFTGEIRVNVGGRLGADPAPDPETPKGPISSFYAGLDGGITYSL